MPACPGCGLTLGSLDEVYGESEVVLTRVVDPGGVFESGGVGSLESEVAVFERSFPQAWMSVYAVSLGSAAALRQFGFWLLNRATPATGGVMRPNENGVLLVVDVEARAVSITIGYQLEPWLPEEVLAAVLAAGRRWFRKGRPAAGAAAVVQALAAALRASLQAPPHEAIAARSPLDGVPRLRGGRKKDDSTAGARHES